MSSCISIFDKAASPDIGLHLTLTSVSITSVNRRQGLEREINLLLTLFEHEEFNRAMVKFNCNKQSRMNL